MRNSTGLLLIGVGAVLIVVGLLVWSGALSWFGRLPGDIRVERPTARLYVPITSMLILSVLLSLVLAIIRRFR
jgi:membrane protein implicated in regulation of membrane protease activity